MAGAVITILPIILIYFFTQKQFTEGIATSGLKG
jgi:ABC-type glycerol-3-phosphate transport system permease component